MPSSISIILGPVDDRPGPWRALRRGRPARRGAVDPTGPARR
ncbi:hypothetical protein [Streptoalloteichus tenebrarius]